MFYFSFPPLQVRSCVHCWMTLKMETFLLQAGDLVIEPLTDVTQGSCSLAHKEETVRGMESGVDQHQLVHVRTQRDSHIYHSF